MNPNSPLSYYQVGAVTVTSGSTTVTGYKTEWETTERAGKPMVGSVFTIDQANFYVVDRIVDDETIILNKPFIMPSQVKTSYLIINQMDVDITEDDEVTMQEILTSVAKAVELAEDWATKMDGTVDGVEYSSKYYAYTSKDWATKMGSTVNGVEYSSKYYAANAKQSADSAEDDKDAAAASAAEAKASEESAKESKDYIDNVATEVFQDAAEVAADAAKVAADRDFVEEKADEVKTDAASAETNAQLAHDYAIGPNPPADLETPTDTNNAAYYAKESKRLHDMVADLVTGVLMDGGFYVPSASKEYPDVPTSSTFWILKPTEPDGYTYTSGIAKDQTALFGDWLIYSVTAGSYELVPVSPLHRDQFVSFEDFAKSDVGGLVKARVDPVTFTLYLTFDGSDA